MELTAHFTEMYMRHLLATPRGRAHVLNQIADAEDNGEARVFDDALALVDDPKLAKMIERHQEDELRHGRLFRECMQRTGIDPGPVPAELRALDRVDRALGNFFSRPLRDARDVMTAYLVLQVLEERALEQFPIYERVFRELDPKTADVFVEVAEDERRHLLYCHAISRRYAPDEDVLKAELTRLRELEAHAFRETEMHNMHYVQSNRLMESASARLFWKALGWVTSQVTIVPRTSFARLAADGAAA